MSRHQPWSEEDLEAAKQRMMVGGGQSKTGAAGERSVCTPSGMQAKAQVSRKQAEATTRTLQNGPFPVMQSFTLYGQLCSGKNQVQILWRNGKVCKYPNKTFTNWRAKAHQDILNQSGLGLRIDVPVVLTCHYTPGDLRTRDITGQLDAIFHLLVYAKVLKDDGLVHEQHWHRLPMNRKSPQVTICIQTLEERP